jgi:hypothetical protein
MLTVLRNNRGAFDFYTGKMKYSIDITSPSMDQDYAETDAETAHEILSKVVDKAAVALMEEKFKV